MVECRIAVHLKCGTMSFLKIDEVSFLWLVSGLMSQACSWINRGSALVWAMKETFTQAKRFSKAASYGKLLEIIQVHYPQRGEWRTIWLLDEWSNTMFLWERWELPAYQAVHKLGNIKHHIF